ncbi:two-component sensor histidine kinase [Rhodoferax koreense]|uniref:histidine kinase n=2 Tax=Rhodoferax koreensis TaxID=1842727 RepID=A0A1P8JSF2_9BURK|nr:ATP-binding protein [Rhodoferax koreense]APW36679.1 two-component sensor histidine kinase [Rhodoferax koreense]
MWKALRQRGGWLLAWCALATLGGVALARQELTRQREAFEADARIAHRLLSQRAAQQDAVLATLALLQPGGTPGPTAQPEQRLSSVYPQILDVQHRGPGEAWPVDIPAARAALAEAEAVSRRAGRVALAVSHLAAGRYRLVLGADPNSYALQIDLAAMVPWNEWPMPRETTPVRLTLEQDGQVFVVQPGRLRSTGLDGWRFEFHKHLATASQPFDVFAVRQVGWAELPWAWMLAWAAATAVLLAALQTALSQRAARRRAEELLRLGQVARLNTLGELAAGMAHELNQPLTAVLANAQAARRLLDEDPPEIDTARGAMTQAAEQARRASSVVGRLRRAVERPDLAGQPGPVKLEDAVREVLYLLEPESTRRGVQPVVQSPARDVTVLADRVALEQIIHNLVMNALQALEQVPPDQRRLTLTIAADPQRGTLTVQDSGPGIPAEVLPRIFEPFFSTRQGGLGLGLNLCESLAGGMGGELSASNVPPHGAALRLALPLPRPLRP